ncbi:uncharacterized protein UBRO_21041 [Ustilago bromivora]|uniref:DDE Tnp4 domain-containing protein n=1 Tax=Ustilago bromivora TaxID=307758 RepID=A0A1K0GIY4_9BASI|nr:uncharacterized protein UBRO_21041 [Ustilago bromivora]
MYHGLVCMSPEAFQNLAIKLQQTQAFQWNYSTSDRMSLNRVQEILLVALYRLGCSGNGGGECDAALQCGCSVGSIVAYTNHTVTGFLELNNEVMQFALEEERKHAAAWVRNTTGVEKWDKGWLVVNGTHVPLAWKPGVHSQEHFCYKGFHSMNVALVILPHSLWIVESVVGQPDRIQDLKVWASGSNILKKPCLYLDKGYCGNIYHVKDHITAAQTIHTCIVTHTFASQYDHPADIADLLLPSFSEDEVHEVMQGLQLDVMDAQDLRRTRCLNQQEYELDLATATQGMLQYALSRHQSSAVHDLQEEMFQALFRSTGCNEEDTTVLSQCHEKTTADYNAMTQSTSAQRQAQALMQPFSI